MKPIINPARQKFIVVAAAAVSFFGLEAGSQALGAYQVGNFLGIALIVYLFLVFWQSFIFDLHLKTTYTWASVEKSLWRGLKERFRYIFERHHFLHYQNYLILPGVLYWAVVLLLYLNPFADILKQAVILAGTLTLATATWYLKTVFYDHHDAHHNVRQVIFLVKIGASYLAFAAVFGASRYFGADAVTFSVSVFALAFLLFHQAFFQHHYNGYRTVEIFAPWGLILAWSAALVFWYWNVNYFSGALMLTALYTTCWGIVQHKYIDKNLTRQIVYEYLSVLFVITALLLSTTNFGERLPPPDQNRYEGDYQKAR